MSLNGTLRNTVRRSVECIIAIQLYCVCLLLSSSCVFIEHCSRYTYIQSKDALNMNL